MADQWIVRRGTPKRGFTYVSASGRVVRDRSTLERITRLRIPPAWRDVRIAASANASVQAWGFDVRGRRQYRYHERAVERGQLSRDDVDPDNTITDPTEISALHTRESVAEHSGWWVREG